MADPRLRPLALADAEALFRFELENRAWFERWVGPRPPSYWELGSLREVIRRQIADGEPMFLIVAEGEILGRLNLMAPTDGVAQLGYRVGARHAGRGVASRAVELALAEAEARGIWTLEARVAASNPAARRVLDKARFQPVAQVPGPPGATTLMRRPLG